MGKHPTSCANLIEVKKMSAKIIGLLGGMSWESTSLYYQLINKGIKERLGGLHSAQIFMVSVDFHLIEQLQLKGEWKKAGQLLAMHAKKIEKAGADFLVICSNTMHKVEKQILSAINIPLLHIGDATAQQIKNRGIAIIGLLGTNFTMEQDFYRGRLRDRHGLQILLPEKEDRDVVNRIIYRELVLGEIKQSSRQKFLEIIHKLHLKGAQGIIAGCTEISTIIQQQDLQIPLFDTTSIHAQAAVELALS